MAKSFREFLDEAKKSKDFEGAKQRVKIADAGAQYFDQNLQTAGEGGVPLNQKYIVDNKISGPAVSLVEEFRNDIESLEGADYNGFISFVRKGQSLLNELEKNRQFKEPDRVYIRSAIEDPLTNIAGIQSATLRAAFAFEDFKKQFKPLKLADRFFGDVAIIGDIIRRKIEDTEAGEQQIQRTGLRVAKERTRERRRLREEQQETRQAVQSTAGDTEQILSDTTTERFEDIGRQQDAGPGLIKRQSEEQQKEANFEREESQNIFEAIMANTAETNEILKELIEVNKDIEDATDGTGSSILELLGAQQVLKKGGKLLKGGAGIATAAGSTVAAKKALSTSKKATPKGNKLKKNIKKVAQVAKTGAKGLAAKVPWLLPIIGAYDVISGAAGAEEILEAAPDEEVSFFDRLGAGIGKFVETSTFGLVDAKSAAEFLGAKAEKKVDSTAEVATEAVAETTLASTYTMDADVVNLRANAIRLGTFDNMMEKMNNDMSDMASFFNNQIVNNNSNQTTVLPPLSSNNSDQSVIVGRNNLYK